MRRSVWGEISERRSPFAVWAQAWVWKLIVLEPQLHSTGRSTGAVCDSLYDSPDVAVLHRLSRAGYQRGEGEVSQ